MHALWAEGPTHTILSTYNHHSMALVKLNLTRIAKTSAMHLYLAIGSLVLAAFQTINHYYAFFFLNALPGQSVLSSLIKSYF